MSEPRAATRRPPTVVVQDDEALAEVIARVREAAAAGQMVHLVVPVESPLLLTASEFRTLKNAIDDERLPVVLRTPDPLRLKLAERLGVQAQVVNRRKAPARPVAPPPASTEPEPEALASFVEIEPVYTGPDPALLWPAQVTDALEPPVEDAADTAPAVAVTRVRRNPPRRWLPVALLLLILIGGAAVLFRALTPQVIVRYVPRTEEVSAAVTFDATTDGKPLGDGAAFAFPTQTQRVDVTWSGDTAATGTETAPDETAGGPVELRNAGSTPQTVDAGTIVTTEDGVEFTVVDAVEVPAADASGAPGAATGMLRAVAAGTGGNVETGAVGGRLPNGVYYSNRMEPTAGGTDTTFTIVDPGDLDALKAGAADASTDLAEKAVNGEAGDQGYLVTAVKVLSQQDTFDHQAGDRTDAVGLTSAMTLEVTTIDLQAAETDFNRVLGEELAANAPANYTILPKDIRVNDPVVVQTADRGVRMEISADAEARMMLDPAQRAQLAASIEGLSAAEAQGVLLKDPALAAATVEISPGWLIRTVPENPDRVTFEDEG